MHIGKKIKELVKGKKMTNEEFAELIYKHPKYVYQIFKQEHINTELLQTISSVLNVPMVYFFKDEKVESYVSDIKEFYGNNYKERFIESLERENKLLHEDNSRLTKKVDQLKKKLGN